MASRFEPLCAYLKQRPQNVRVVDLTHAEINRLIRPHALPASARRWTAYWLPANARGPGRHPIADALADAGWHVDTAQDPTSGVVRLRRAS